MSYQFFITSHSDFDEYSFDSCKNFSLSFSFRKKEPYDNSAHYALSEIYYWNFTQNYHNEASFGNDVDRWCLLGLGDPPLPHSFAIFVQKISHSTTAKQYFYFVDMPRINCFSKIQYIYDGYSIQGVKNTHCTKYALFFWIHKVKQKYLHF